MKWLARFVVNQSVVPQRGVHEGSATMGFLTEELRVCLGQDWGFSHTISVRPHFSQGCVKIEPEFGFTKGFPKEWKTVSIFRRSTALCGFKEQARLSRSCEKCAIVVSQWVKACVGNSFGYLTGLALGWRVRFYAFLSSHQ